MVSKIVEASTTDLAVLHRGITPGQAAGQAVEAHTLLGRWGKPEIGAVAPRESRCANHH